MAVNKPNEKGEHGVIVNVSSGVAWEGQICQSTYGASKSRMIGSNMPTTREFGALGIRVNAIVSGLFAPPMVK